MPKVIKNLQVPYSAQQMYDLINAVELYPSFLPWCKSAAIHERSPSSLHATLEFAKGPITYSITTHNQMQPGSSIAMRYAAGPFKTCHGSWNFLQRDQHCQISFVLEYQFINKIKQLLIEPVFHPIADSLIDAFYARAEQIYGKK